LGMVQVKWEIKIKAPLDPKSQQIGSSRLATNHIIRLVGASLFHRLRKYSNCTTNIDSKPAQTIASPTIRKTCGNSFAGKRHHILKLFITAGKPAGNVTSCELVTA